MVKPWNQRADSLNPVDVCNAMLAEIKELREALALAEVGEFAAQASIGHLGAAVDELRAELAALESSASVTALRQALGAPEKVSPKMLIDVLTQVKAITGLSTKDDDALEALEAKLQEAIHAPEPYDQQSLELCEKCGWKAIVPGEPCLMCERHGRMIALDEMQDIADRYAHRMAMTLECVLMDRSSDRWWDEGMQLISEYRMAMNAIHERESPTFMGEPVIRLPADDTEGGEV